MYDNRIMADYCIRLMDYHGGGPKRRISVGSVDIENGMYRIFNQTHSTHDLCHGVAGSGSVPLYFGPNKFNRTTNESTWSNADPKHFMLNDGGGIYNNNFISAIHSCRELVANDSMITIDILNTYGYSSAKPYNETGKNTINNMGRFKDLWLASDPGKDVSEAERAFPEVTFRHFMHPHHHKECTLLDFDNHTAMNDTIKMGRLEGENYVKLKWLEDHEDQSS